MSQRQPLTITKGNVRCAERDYEIIGGPLDALTLADLFVQVFTLDMDRKAISDVASKAEDDGLVLEAAAVCVALDLWASAEAAYDRLGKSDRKFRAAKAHAVGDFSDEIMKRDERMSERRRN